MNQRWLFVLPITAIARSRTITAIPTSPSPRVNLQKSPLISRDLQIGAETHGVNPSLKQFSNVTRRISMPLTSEKHETRKRSSCGVENSIVATVAFCGQRAHSSAN
jgi:hypothetical protein